MSQWVRLCALGEAPAPGTVKEEQAGEQMICLANVGGKLHALGNVCPHRGAPLGQGWIESGKLLCPWHAWTFDVETGQADYPPEEKVPVFPLRIEGEDVLVELQEI